MTTLTALYAAEAARLRAHALRATSNPAARTRRRRRAIAEAVA